MLNEDLRKRLQQNYDYELVINKLFKLFVTGAYKPLL